MRALKDPLQLLMWVAAGEDHESHISYWDKLTPEIIEKFAEMIVADCCLIAEKKEQGLGGYRREYSVGWYIRGHFGIKPDEPKFIPKQHKPWTEWPKSKI